MTKFDESFLAARIVKQADWVNKGVRAGSGKPFAPISVQANRFAGGFGEAATTAGGFGGISLRGEAKGSLKKGSKSKASGKPIGSPHAMALASLAKNPQLRTGGMVGGKRIPASHEHWEQVIVFDWLYREQPDFYDDFSAVPMGGLRNTKTAIGLMAEGAKSGYPDITGDVARGEYHGLFIEMKWGSNKPTDIQKQALNRKVARGYFAAVCYSHEEAIAVITEYLALPAGGVMTWDKNTELWKGAE